MPPDVLRKACVVHAIMERHGPNESFVFSHQILDGVAPPLMVRSVACVLPIDPPNCIDQVACLFFAVVVRPPHAERWRIEQRTLLGAGEHVFPAARYVVPVLVSV